MSETTQTPTAERRSAHPALAAVGMTAGLGAILVVLLALFILPSLKSGPHGLPLAVVGSASDVASVVDALEATAPRAYDLRTDLTVDQVEDAIRDRAVVGALVVEDDSLHAHVASAGSTAISGTVTATATELSRTLGRPLAVTDVVPLPADDPTGIGVGGLAFPLVFGGIVPVVAFANLFKRSHAWHLTGIVSFSVVGGLVVSAVLQLWFGSTDGVFWQVAGSMALGIAGLALPLAGLQQLFGGKGFTAGAMVMMFLGNPLSGIATTGSWLPSGLGAFGQALPPGATGALVRSAAYFDFAGAAVPLLTLVLWVLLGAALTAVALLRPRAEVEAGPGA